jgi:hypothetical protein
MRDDFTLTRHLASVRRAKQNALSSPAKWSEATRRGGGGPPERAQRVSGGGGGLRDCALTRVAHLLLLALLRRVRA